ncbi:MAG TPA: GntR family transcriptional regulator, partial [Casimicrobiaceae bacterium]|nr:GntR family transcriptional regulator [Casimicrobiaceae bacterium]
MTDATVPGVPLPAPLYRELERKMRDALASGEWKPGEAIPAERRLAERYGVSIGTVRKAIDALADANLVIRQQGRGTFVATHNRDRMMFYFFHIVPEGGAKEYPVVRLVAFVRGKADRVEAERLALAPGDPVFRVRNLLFLSGEPIIVDDLSVAAARFPGLTEKQFRDRPSTIYNLYQDAFGITVARSSERLRAGVAD